jgi:hypothetical protein
MRCSKFTDAKVVLRDPERSALQAADHLEIAVVTPDDEFLRFAVEARGTGKASVSLLTADDEQVPDPRILAVFRLVPGGYLIELRLPRSLIGPRLGFTIVNADDPAAGSPVTSIGTSDTSGKQSLGAVIVPSPEVSELVRRLGRARSRIWVLDVNRRVIAQAGTLRAPPPEADPDQTVFMRFWESAADVLVRPILRLAMSEPNEDFQDIAPGTYRLEGREIDEALAGRTGTRRRLTPDSRAVVLSAAQTGLAGRQGCGCSVDRGNDQRCPGAAQSRIRKLFRRPARGLCGRHGGSADLCDRPVAAYPPAAR